MRRVLIVSPHFPPLNAPDHQRVRMSLPYFQAFGWEPTVLAVKSEAVDGGVVDPLLERTIPKEMEVARVGAVPAQITRLAGLGSLAFRALPYLWRAGNHLLARADRRRASEKQERKFDLVYFSTTQFPALILGPIWLRRFGVPYVVDFQDPWISDYYESTGTVPPGGKGKYWISQRIARQLEPRVMKDVAEIICVSPAYVETLRDRYPSLRPEQFTVLPFGAPTRDFEMLPLLEVKQTIFDPAEGRIHWTYVGRGGDDMAVALRVLFSAFHKERQREPEKWKNLRMHFIGTSYAPAHRAQESVTPIARECGVADMVEERTERVPYFEALQILTESDALIVIGSDSPSYSASKLYPYMLARKPLLAVLHEESPAVGILCECRAGEVVTFNPADPRAAFPAMTAALLQTFEMASNKERANLNETQLATFNAREMTRKQSEVFDRAIAGIQP